ncbi:MAG TPA: ComF family protein [Pseudomonadales bacterium]
MVYNALQSLLFTLIPPTCLLCQAPAEGGSQLDLCPGCERDLPRIHWPCPKCGLELNESEHILTCGSCLVTPPAWDHCISATAYAGPVNRLIPHWKRRGHSPAGRVLTRLLAERLRDRPSPRDWPKAIVPVPQHWQRSLIRGFNPAEGIARQLGRALNLPMIAHALQRIRATPQQQGLSARERRRNLKGAFAVRAPLPAHIALVDDVVTTGSTAEAICRLLRQQGVERIELWCLARTPKA